MTEPRIDPANVTKPIQLLAAWLAGLVITDSAFLTAAAAISEPEWAAGALVIASILNVPLFLAALFLLQTKFRPEMQEDSFYAKYLERRYSNLTNRTETIVVQQQQLSGAIERRSLPRPDLTEGVAIEINDLLPHFAELVKTLASQGIHPDSTFGSTSKRPKVPEKFVIAVGDGVPISLLQRVVKAAIPYGLDGVQLAFSDGDSGGMHNKRLYLGSYGIEHEPYLPTTPQFLERLMAPALTESGLRELLSTRA